MSPLRAWATKATSMTANKPERPWPASPNKPQRTQVKNIRAKADGAVPLGTRGADGMKNPSDVVIELAKNATARALERK
jgi:hypothetical protein